jgi:hypothetical protein
VTLKLASINSLSMRFKFYNFGSELLIPMAPLRTIRKRGVLYYALLEKTEKS